MLTCFVVWCETFAATSLYRCRDVANQVGWPAYLIYTIGFAVAQGLGIRVAYGSTPGTGAGVGFAFFILSSFIAVFAAKTPGIPAPRFWGNSKFMSRFWWVAFYPGNQLTRDLNVVIGVGKNWNIPYYWAAIMRVCLRRHGRKSFFAPPANLSGFLVHIRSYPCHCPLVCVPQVYNYAHVRPYYDLRLQHSASCSADHCPGFLDAIVVQLDHPVGQDSPG
jgi:hypothetical protein